MSLNRNALARFRGRIDDTLEELFPCFLSIGGLLIAASGPGGRTMNRFEEGGSTEDFRLTFRIDAADIPPVRKGTAVDWLVSPGYTIPMEVIDVGIRPHEARHSITCRPRRIPAGS